MSENMPAVAMHDIVKRIFEFRGQRVMQDEDLAVLYGVETRALIQAVKRNADRFPKDFMFQLSAEEWASLKSQNVTSKGRGGRRYAPYAFTEHGALMLSAVLNSEQATKINILIIRAFVWMRQDVPAYEETAAKLQELEGTVSRHDAALGCIIETLHEMMAPSGVEKGKIGF